MKSFLLCIFITFNAYCNEVKNDDPFYFLNDIYDEIVAEEKVENFDENIQENNLEINVNNVEIYICDYFAKGYDCVAAERWGAD